MMTVVNRPTGLAHDDCPQPGPESFGISQRVQSDQCSSEFVGRSALAGGEAATYSIRGGPCSTPVAGKEFTDSRSVTAFGEFDKFSIGMCAHLKEYVWRRRRFVRRILSCAASEG